MKKIAPLIIAIFLLISCKGGALSNVTRCNGGALSNVTDPLKDAKTGDVVFQKLPGELSQVISEVTESPIAHCGMVIKEENGAIDVIEAVGPVRIIPLEQFIKNGIDSKYALIRLKDKNFKDFSAVANEAKKFLGKPYDFLYQFDDEHIYCSELVYKAFLNAAKIKIAKTIKLKDLKYKDNIDFIKSLTGGDLPLDREMVTPVDIYKSDLFEMKFSNY